eukprot:CCRYP_017331-RA/>CCRYP_017331-RA protein AED:0.34 eAED:0.34 QI:0/0/0/1/0/0/2/0/180
MPGFVTKQLTKYNHPPPKKPVNTPWEPYPIKYGNPIQPTLPQDDSPQLNKQQIRQHTWTHAFDTTPQTWSSTCTPTQATSPCKIRAAGIFFLGSLPKTNQLIKLNGAIIILCTIVKFVATCAAEAELGALLFSAKEAKTMRLTLEELGHSQPPNPIHCDNSTTVGIVDNTVKWQKSRRWK